MQASLPPTGNGEVQYVYLLNAAQFEQYLQQGFRVYYLPGMREFNLQVYGLDLDPRAAVLPAA